MTYEIKIKYNKSNSNLLSNLSKKYGSDKGSPHTNDSGPFYWNYHTYTDFYSIIFENIRDKSLNIFECGIGSNDESIKSNMTSSGIPGASLRMWKEYFPNSNIYGADIDKKILFNEERIKTFFIDQTLKQSILDMWSNIPEMIDIIIDDGLHEFYAGVTLYENSIHKLKKDGIYIIEDVHVPDILQYESYFFARGIDFLTVYLSGPDTAEDNNLIIVSNKSNIVEKIDI